MRGREGEALFPHPGPRERQRERIDNRLQGGRLAAETRRKRRAAQSARRVGPAGASLKDAGPSTTDPALAADFVRRELMNAERRLYGFQGAVMM